MVQYFFAELSYQNATALTACLPSPAPNISPGPKPVKMKSLTLVHNLTIPLQTNHFNLPSERMIGWPQSVDDVPMIWVQ
jgi:hypothetical protein